jgi:hypothetical protein
VISELENYVFVVDLYFGNMDLEMNSSNHLLKVISVFFINIS